jgi:hypothetical protein
LIPIEEATECRRTLSDGGVMKIDEYEETVSIVAAKQAPNWV